MSARRAELTRAAARLFAEKGYHGTSIGDLAEALGVQKGSLYAHIESKEDLLWESPRGRRGVPRGARRRAGRGPALERIRLALRRTSRVVSEQLDVATVFVREWRYLDGERREEFVAARRRYEERMRDLFREGRERASCAPTSSRTAALLLLSAANWAYTWLGPGRGHGRARRSVLRAPDRRHARLLRRRVTTVAVRRSAAGSIVLIVNPFATRVTDERLAAVEARSARVAVDDRC